MINFSITTCIDKNYQFIFDHFDKNLFLYLAPSNLQLLRFDGSKRNDIVHIQFSFPKAEWISEITHYEKTENHILFIDIGRKLPFGLKAWEHKHYIKRINDNESEIIDQVNFSAKNKFIEYLLFFPLFLPLYFRKKLYPRYFNSL